MSNSIAVSPEKFIFAQDSELKTTSLKVAEAFNKRHSDVLRSIDKISTQVSDNFNKRNFALIQIDVELGSNRVRKDKAYEMTKDGFMLLVMSYTGQKAMSIKEAYINAFNLMHKKLFPVRNALVDIPQERKTLQSKKGGLTLEQQDTIKNIVRSTAEALPKDKRAGITIKMWSAIKKKFDLGKGQTYKDVPEEEFNNVISLLARLPLDGELLPKAKEETQDNSITLTLKPLVNNKHRRVLVTQAKDFMVTLWELDDDQQVLTEQTAIRELRELGYLVLKNDDASINKLVFSYLPSDKLPIFIEKAANRLRAIQQAKLMPA